MDNDLKISWFSVLTVAVVSTLGVKVTNLCWDKFVAPKVNKK